LDFLPPQNEDVISELASVLQDEPVAEQYLHEELSQYAHDSILSEDDMGGDCDPELIKGKHQNPASSKRLYLPSNLFFFRGIP
jgi:hypothetical protein